MSLNEQFDELARQKLEEQVFPFDEAAWLQAEKAISARRRRRGWMLWFFPSILLLGLLAWWALPPDDDQNASAEASVTVEGSAQTEGRATAIAVEPRQGSFEHAKATEKEGTVPEPKSSERATPVSETRSSGDAALGRVSGTVTGDRLRKGHDGVANRSENEPRVDGDGASAPVINAAMDSRPAMDPAQDKGGNAEQPNTKVNANQQLASSATADVEPKGESQWGDPDDSVNRRESQEAPPALEEVMGQAHAQIADSVHTAAASTSADSSAAPTLVTAPSDSAGSAMPEPVAPLVAPRSPWELSAMAGMYSTTSRYAFPQQGDWTVTPEGTAAYGAEAMRMGRNFGYGFGVQYGTYADRLATPEQRRTTMELERYWYLQPVDTTLLIITDSSFNGQGEVEYYGLSVPTTVMVIRSAYDTTYATTLLRQARARMNRTSYIELPILFDAHLTQGRWSIGLRGGPALGMLTTRSGAVPGEGADADLVLDDAITRRYVLGWTARAYVRYRFNSAWSIGIEPAARGQLSDGLASPAASRRSRALGAAVTLSYRLR